MNVTLVLYFVFFLSLHLTEYRSAGDNPLWKMEIGDILERERKNSETETTKMKIELHIKYEVYTSTVVTGFDCDQSPYTQIQN